MFKKKIAFIGAGNMARAIINGFFNKNIPAKNIYVTAPTNNNLKKITQNINSSNNNLDVLSCDIIFLALKPYQIKELAAELNGKITNKTILISILAGVDLESLTYLFKTKNIIRIIPNTPVAINMGIIPIFYINFNHLNIKVALDLLGLLGEKFILKKEDEINKFIAISGSSPAYLFDFLDAMVKKTIDFGFDETTAQEIIKKTAKGIFELAEKSNLSFLELADNVTSKNGTTAKAREELEKNNLASTVAKAMDKAYLKAKEMTNATKKDLI